MDNVKEQQATKDARGASELKALLGVLLIVLMMAGCQEGNNESWEYKIGEKAIHKLTMDTVIVVDRRSIASGIIAIRHKNYELTEAREEELNKIED